jgi:hypothetical protein
LEQNPPDFRSPHYDGGFKEMAAAKDCQRYAARCLQDARETLDSRQKSFLVEMAQAWQRLAEREISAKNGYAGSASEIDRGD